MSHINAVPAEDIDNSEKFILSKADWQSFKINARNLLTADLISQTVSADKNATLLTFNYKAAKLRILQSKNRKKRLRKRLPYWNEDCNKAIRERNKARNAMHKNKTLEKCIRYRHLKGTAQRVIKFTARQYWQNYGNILEKSTKLGTIWRMAKRMNGIHSGEKFHLVELNILIKISSKQPKSSLLCTFRPLSEAFIRRSWY